MRFGDYVVLQHMQSSSVLACDPTEDLAPGQNKFIVTTFAGTPAPRARNTFRIVRPTSALKNFEDDERDPVLKIGQPFLLQCNESLLVDGSSTVLAPSLFLSSIKKTERNATKSTNRQLVYLSPNRDAEAVWIVVKPSQGKANIAERALSHGCPVMNNEHIIFTHRQTNMYLCCDPSQTMKTEFGVELECYADRSASTGKLGLLVSEFKGTSTASTLSKPDLPNFVWMFLQSEDRSSNADNRQLPPSASIEVLVAELRNYIVASGGMCGFWDFRAYFQALDKRSGGNGKIDRNDLKDAITSWGCPFDGRYLDSIIDCIDERRIGLVDWRDFISLLRGPLTDSRQDTIIEVFSSLDSRGDGVISLDDVSRLFQGIDHPLVSQKGQRESDAVEHILGYFRNVAGAKTRSPTAATYETFCNYYADLSAAVDDDGYFNAILRSNFNL